MESKPEWVKVKPAEMEKIVLDLYKQGSSPAKIGLILRDKHGIPRAKLLGKKVSQIIKSQGLQDNSDRSRVADKISFLEKHIAKNKHDYTAKRSLTKTLWVVKKFEKSN